MARATPAVTLLERHGIAFTLHPYEHDPRTSGYGDEAAAALGVSPRQIFKTLIADAGGLAIAVVPVATSLDLKAFAAALGTKRAVMADPAAAERATGYVRGGISPLGGRKRLPIVIDSAATDLQTVFVSAGRRGLQVQLAATDLIAVSGATLAPIAHG